MASLTVYATDSTEETYASDLIRFDKVFNSVRSRGISCNTTITEFFRYDKSGIEQKIISKKYEMSGIIFPS